MLLTNVIGKGFFFSSMHTMMEFVFWQPFSEREWASLPQLQHPEYAI
jgi:hypothetical protein